MKYCSRCHRSKEDKEFQAPRTCIRCSEYAKKHHDGKGHGSSQEWKEENRDRLRKYNRAWRTSYKSQVLQHYGMKCACCGESDIRFLTIDHRDGGGRKHREEIGTGPGVPFYRWLKANNYPEGYTVLCFNCNCGRSVNGGICPHKEEKLDLSSSN